MNMIEGGAIVGEVFKHITRDIWVQVKSTGHSTQFGDRWVEFDILYGDEPWMNSSNPADREYRTVLDLRTFHCLFSSAGA